MRRLIAGALALACLVAGTALFAARHAGGLFRLSPGATAAQRESVGGPAVALATPPSPATDGGDPAAAARAIVTPSAPPARLVIPVLGVDATVEAVGVDAQGRMATPSEADHVAWYSPGATPGDAGDAVIDGHLDWTSGPAVFWYLARLHAGDRVAVVRTDGSRVEFVVDTSADVPFDARIDGLFARTGPPTLSLVTCAGTWDRQRATYLQRLVVHATLAAMPPTEKPGDEGG